MKTIDEVLKLNTQSSYSFTVAASISNTIEMINRTELDALLYIEAGNLVVMVSAGDFRGKVILEKITLDETLLREILDQMVIYSSNPTEVEQHPAIDPEQHNRYLPVMLDGFLIGEISRKDFSRLFLQH